MKIGYTVLGKGQELTDVQVCQILSKDDCFAGKRIEFQRNRKNQLQPVLRDKVQGIFNPINRLLFAAPTVTFDHKRDVIIRLGGILKHYSQTIAADEELIDKVDRCSTEAISKNLKALEKKFFKGATPIQKQLLATLFLEVQEALKLGNEVNAYQSTVPTDPKCTEITVENFFNLLQKPEGLTQKFQILKDRSIYIRPKEKQGWIFKKPVERAAAKIAVAQMIRNIVEGKATQEMLKDEKKFNLPLICKALEEIRTKMVRNTTESEALGISRHLTDAIVCLDELYRSIQEKKPTLGERAYNATKQVLTDAALFVPKKTGNLVLYLLKGGLNLTIAGAYSLANRVDADALDQVKLGGV